ncbi:MAG TPA: VOC family protein [Pseudolabrys sp.]|nr:VOC family protein [Pseudolabrys sp.]
MVQLDKTNPGRFCWLDLAASDADSAKAFYGKLFGWTAHEQPANGGSFTRLRLSDHDVGSLYQLRDALLDHGMPSHWTPYVRVDNVEDAVWRAIRLGGTVVADPFVVSGIARIALIQDSVGALIGLWEPIALNMKVNGHG